MIALARRIISAAIYRPRIFAPLIAVIIVPLNALGDIDRIAAFKQFLASPPALQTLTFKKRDLYQPSFPGALKVDTNAWHFYRAQWQNPDFMIIDGDSLQEVTARGGAAGEPFSVHGKSEQVFWKVIGDNYIFWNDKQSRYSKEIVPLTDFPSDAQVLAEVSVSRGILLQAINLGIGDLRPGTLNWDGDSFTAEALSHMTLTGKLIEEGGVPKEIRYYRGEIQGSPAVIHYDYSGSHVLLPDHFYDEYTDANGAKTRFTEFSILTVEKAVSQIPAKAFTAAPFMVKGYTKTLEQAGKNFYWKDPQGRHVQIVAQRPVKNVPRWFIAAIVFVSVLLLVGVLYKNFRGRDRRPSS